MADTAGELSQVLCVTTPPLAQRVVRPWTPPAVVFMAVAGGHMTPVQHGGRMRVCSLQIPVLSLGSPEVWLLDWARVGHHALTPLDVILILLEKIGF